MELGKVSQVVISQCSNECQVDFKATRAVLRDRDLLDHAQKQQQIVFKFWSTAAGQESKTSFGVGQAIAAAQNRIHKRIANEHHLPLQLFAEIFCCKGISTEHRLKPLRLEAASAGPWKSQSTLVMTGVSHQIRCNWPPAEPCRHHGDHIPDHYH